MKKIINKILISSFILGLFAIFGNTVFAAPNIVSANVSGITTTDATLNTTVDSNGFDTAVTFSVKGIGNGMGGGMITAGTTNSFSMPLTGLSPNTQYEFKVVATDSNGDTVDGSWISFTTNQQSNGGGGVVLTGPTIVSAIASNVTLTSATLEGTVNHNGFDTAVSFSIKGIGNGMGSTMLLASSSNTKFSLPLTGLSPNTQYEFKVVATDSNGNTVDGNWISFTTSTGGNGGGGSGGGSSSGGSSSNLNLVTTVNATNIGSTYTKVNAVFLNKKLLSAKGYFEYGTTNALGQKTDSVNLGTTSQISFSKIMLNLKANTTYYFRAVVESNGTIDNGSILSFKTKTATDFDGLTDEEIIKKNNNQDLNDTPPEEEAPIVVEQSRVIQITTNKEDVYVGDEVSYFIKFQNTTGTTLLNTKVLVQLPKEIDYKESTFGQMTNDNNLIFDIGTLFNKEDGTLSITGTVNQNASTSNVFLTTAVMSYNLKGTNGENNELAYVSNNILQTTNLAANSLFGIGTFFPSTILGWMILAITILCLIIVVRIIYSEYSDKKNKKVSAPENLPM